MNRYTILWADDEIQSLKPHILFLKDKGYDVTTVNSGADAIDMVSEQDFDVVFLDENMPGISGLTALTKIKALKPNLPVVMITKSEEENIMEDAIGSKIEDYLIKPINPVQILSSVKKILENKRLISEKTQTNYRQEFNEIFSRYNDRLNHQEWAELYSKLVYWDLEIQSSQNSSISEVFTYQKEEANSNFIKFVMDEYEDWINDAPDAPVMSHKLLKEKVFPLMVKDETPIYFILIDNLRLDQWKKIQPIIMDQFVVEEDSTYYSILPTTTAYARNAIFAGLTPLEMQKKLPELWRNDDDEEGKNLHEEEFLIDNLKRNKLGAKKISYHKIVSTQQGKDLYNAMDSLKNNHLNVMVFNFVDMLSHSRAELSMIQELTPDDSAYRTITESWFNHSTLKQVIEKIAAQKARIVITTDHGTIRVDKPVKIVGDRNVNTNLRYKQGKNLGYDEKEMFICKKPEHFKLPTYNVSTAYAFALGKTFFAYPNNYNYYVNHYKNTFQHGGVSMEEMIIPFVVLKSKG